ncbi:MAG: DUF4113 domain-containing protein, partial [Chitinophagaceae bacterium]
ITIQLERASNNTAELIRYSLKALNIIYKDGYKFMKCGVIVQDLVPESSVQASVFEKTDLAKSKKIMETCDIVNKIMGKETIRMATQGFKKRYKMRADYLSKKYTTDITEIIKIKI